MYFVECGWQHRSVSRWSKHLQLLYRNHSGLEITSFANFGGFAIHGEKWLFLTATETPISRQSRSGSALNPVLGRLGEISEDQRIFMERQEPALDRQGKTGRETN